jgi:hypothetical protein
MEDKLDDSHRWEDEQDATSCSGEDKPDSGRPRRTTRIEPSVLPFGAQPPTQQKRRPVKDRWFYEPVKESKAALIAQFKKGRETQGEMMK